MLDLENSKPYVSDSWTEAICLFEVTLYTLYS